MLRPVGAAAVVSPLTVTEAVSRTLSFVRAEWWMLLLTSHTETGAKADLPVLEGINWL